MVLSANNDHANFVAFNILYLRAASLHLRLSVFFNSPTAKDYRRDLHDLWLAATSFLESSFSLETSAGNHLAYATNYILQMIVAGGFTLLKLLRSFFVDSIDLSYGRALFTRTILAIRTISVANNDLPSRLAEVLAQLWRGGGPESKTSFNDGTNLDNSLQLKVTCRMSMSLVYDSVWRWREDFQSKGSNLEGMRPEKVIIVVSNHRQLPSKTPLILIPRMRVLRILLLTRGLPPAYLGVRSHLDPCMAMATRITRFLTH